MTKNRTLKLRFVHRSNLMANSIARVTLVLALLGATPALAQQQGNFPTAPLERGSVISPVLTIDSERVYTESAYGKRIASDHEERLVELGAENRKIEAELASEELEITARRAAMTPEAFRELANAFDAKVQKIKQTQVSKEIALTGQLEKARDDFWASAAPVLERLMRDADAAVILERRSVFVSVSVVEITEDAIQLFDQTLGDGTDKE